MKSFIIKIVLLVVFICSLYGNVSVKQNATNKYADMEKQRFVTTNTIMEMYYKEHIPEEFCNAFIYYTRTCPDIRQEFYSIMVHESGNFKSYVNKNANGSYDLGPSQLNSYNLKNKYFMELYSPRDKKHINSTYTYYMVITINFYRDLVSKYGKEYALYAYNGGEKCIKLIKENNKDPRYRSLIRNVTNYKRSVTNILTLTKLKMSHYVRAYRLANNSIFVNKSQRTNLSKFIYKKMFNMDSYDYLCDITKNFDKLVNTKEIYYIRRRNEFAELNSEELKIDVHPLIRALEVQFA